MKKYFITAVMLLSFSSYAGADQRTVIELSPEHRDMVLTEMRDFLKTVQQINLALSEEDFAQAAK